MTRHPFSLENLIDWLDGRLDDQARQALEAHLNSGCPTCEAELDWLGEVREITIADDTVEPSAGAVARVKAIYDPKRSRSAPGLIRPRLLSPARLTLGLAALALLFAAVFATYSPTILARGGTVTGLEGTVYAQDIDGAEWRVVGLGDRLGQGNRIRASEGRAVLTLFDGSTLEMGAGSEITLSSLRSSLLRSPYGIALRQQAGFVLYEVDPLSSRRSVFQVQSPTALVTVRGTSFALTVVSELETTVAVYVGSVEVQGPADSAILTANEVAVVPASKPLRVVPLRVPTTTPQVLVSPSASVTQTATPRPTDTGESTGTPQSTYTLEATLTPKPTDTQEPMGALPPTNTPAPTGRPELVDTPEPTDTPQPTDTREPTDTPEPTGTLVPTNTPEPTDTPSGSVPSRTPLGVSTETPGKPVRPIDARTPTPTETQWDRSSLAFIGQGSNCDEAGSVWATIKNGDDAEAMEGTVSWELWYGATGNPKLGRAITTGTIPPLGPGETHTASVAVDISGRYKFKVYQGAGHVGAGVLWSEDVPYDVTDCARIHTPTETPSSLEGITTPEPPGRTKTPQPPGRTKTPQPPGRTKTPQPPGRTKTPQPPGRTKTHQPPGLTKTPQPPGQTKTPPNHESGDGS